MARKTTSRRDAPEISGSVVVWLAGLVFGLGVGVVMVYSLLLDKNSGGSFAPPASTSQSAPRLRLEASVDADLQARAKPRASESDSLD